MESSMRSGAGITITSVSYSRLRSFGNVENLSIAATATVPEDGDPSLVLDGVRDWVTERLAEQIDTVDMRSQVEDLRYRLRQYQDKIEAAEKRWGAILKFLDSLGIKRPSNIPDTLEGLPF